jgi:hypothetical protein
MSARLRIEKALESASGTLGKPFFPRYQLLKARLLEIDYNFWAGGFRGGNDHGPGHINRVLAYLDQLLGQAPVEFLSEYELFLAMMAVLYHDLGILRSRANHASISAVLLGEEKNEYVIDSHDRDIISAAVVSHSSTKDIAVECSRFSSTEVIGGQNVRPRVVAALVRLADELDEDYRRSDPLAAERIDLPADSLFYWQFCQRVMGVQPQHTLHEIRVFLEFEPNDLGRIVGLGGSPRLFVVAVAEKLEKMNRERATVNRFLPPTLQYNRMSLTLRPLKGRAARQHPVEFVFTDNTTAAQFLANFPELVAEPTSNTLAETLNAIRTGDLERAEVRLAPLFAVRSDLPSALRLKVVYDAACIRSLKAEKLTNRSSEWKGLLSEGYVMLREWVDLGLKEGFAAKGETAENEIYRMSCDSDLRQLLAECGAKLRNYIPEQQRNALSTELPPKRRGGGGRGSGCVPAGTPITTSRGQVRVQDLRPGDDVLSVSCNGIPRRIVSRVVRVYTSRETEHVRLDGHATFTVTQPVYEVQRGFVPAGKLRPGMSVLTEGLEGRPLASVEPAPRYAEVYTLETDHPSHNYIAFGLVCGNKERVF